MTYKKQNKKLSHTDELKIQLNRLYDYYNHYKFIHPDPLEFLYNYKDRLDQEIVGLIASSLAYGKVNQILKNVQKILNILGKRPRLYLMTKSPSEIKKDILGFKYRFTTEEDMFSLLIGIRGIIKQYGSLETGFKSHLNNKKHPKIIYALMGFCEEIKKASGNKINFLIPSPSKGSACKRFNLFLRWMVRSDKVDPGCWEGIPSSILIVPVDTHMFTIAHTLGFTKRKNVDLKTAIEITEKFKYIQPNDPVKYDFALTRLGIRDEMDIVPFL